VKGGEIPEVESSECVGAIFNSFQKEMAEDGKDKGRRGFIEHAEKARGKPQGGRP